MSNILYTKAKEKILSGGIDFSTDTFKVALIDTALYTNNATTDEFLSVIAGGAIVFTSDALTGLSVTGGIFVANDITLGSVTGPTSEALVIYKDTGSAATSPLLLYIDTATYLPITPNGGDILIEWNSGDGKIFSI